jgi:hypothetical protein
VNRRSVLAAIGTASLAGCLNRAADALNLSTPLASISHVATETEGIGLDVAVTRERSTTARPARVELAFTNETDTEVTLSLSDDDQLAGPLESFTPDGFEAIDGDQRIDTGLVLVPTPVKADSQRADCWQYESPPRPLIPTSTDLAPGESLRREYEVWDDHVNDGCYPPETYRFGSWGETGPVWRFSLRVEGPTD